MLHCRSWAGCGSRVVLSRRAGPCGGQLSGSRCAPLRPSGGPTATASTAAPGWRTGPAVHAAVRTGLRRPGPSGASSKSVCCAAWGPARIAYLLGLNPSTVHRVPARYGLARLRWLDRATGRAVRRYEHPRPGDLVHVEWAYARLYRSDTERCTPSPTGYTPTITTAATPHSAATRQPAAFPTSQVSTPGTTAVFRCLIIVSAGGGVDTAAAVEIGYRSGGSGHRARRTGTGPRRRPGTTRHARWAPGTGAAAPELRAGAGTGKGMRTERRTPTRNSDNEPAEPDAPTTPPIEFDCAMDPHGYVRPSTTDAKSSSPSEDSGCRMSSGWARPWVRPGTNSPLNHVAPAALIVQEFP